MLRKLKFKVRFAVISGLLLAETNSLMAMEMELDDVSTNPVKRATDHEKAGETLQALKFYRALALTSEQKQKAEFYLKAGDLSFKYYQESLSNAHNPEKTKGLSFRETRALAVKSVAYLEESKVHYASAFNSADSASQKLRVSRQLIDFYKKLEIKHLVNFENLEKLGEYSFTAAIYSSSETDKIAFYHQATEAFEKMLSKSHDVSVSPFLGRVNEIGILPRGLFEPNEGSCKVEEA